MTSPTPKMIKDLLSKYVEAGKKQTDLILDLKEKYSETIHSISTKSYWELKYQIEAKIKLKRDAKKNKY